MKQLRDIRFVLMGLPADTGIFVWTEDEGLDQDYYALTVIEDGRWGGDNELRIGTDNTYPIQTLDDFTEKTGWMSDDLPVVRIVKYRNGRADYAPVEDVWFNAAQGAVYVR